MNFRFVFVITYFLCFLINPSLISAAEEVENEREIHKIADEIKNILEKTKAHGITLDPAMMNYEETTRNQVERIRENQIDPKSALLLANHYLKELKKAGGDLETAPATKIEYNQEKPHWSKLKEYIRYTNDSGIQPKLVVGCGHFDVEDTSIIQYTKTHTADSTSKHHSKFAHHDSFTINIEGETVKFCPDLNKNFVKTEKLDDFDNKFAEVFFESLGGLPTTKMYTRAYKILRPKGQLIDDRYYGNLHNGNDAPDEEIKNQTRDKLRAAGFITIVFHDHYYNPRNGRKNQYIVVATK